MLGFVVGYCSFYFVERILKLFLYNKFKTEDDFREYQRKRDEEELFEFLLYKNS